MHFHLANSLQCESAPRIRLTTQVAGSITCCSAPLGLGNLLMKGMLIQLETMLGGEDVGSQSQHACILLTAITRELRSSVTCVGVVAMCIPLKCTIQPSPASACGQLANALISGPCNTEKVYATLCAVVQSTTRKLPRRARLARCQVRCALTAVAA